jgi:hypothetical protein
LFEILFPLKIVDFMDPSNLPHLIENLTNHIKCAITYWKWEIKWKDKSNLFIFQILVKDSFTSNREYLMIEPSYGIKNKIKREFSDINRDETWDHLL